MRAEERTIHDISDLWVRNVYLRQRREPSDLTKTMARCFDGAHRWYNELCGARRGVSSVPAAAAAARAAVQRALEARPAAFTVLDASSTGRTIQTAARGGPTAYREHFPYPTHIRYPHPDVVNKTHVIVLWSDYLSYPSLIEPRDDFII